MGTHSGEFAAVNNVPAVRQWNVVIAEPFNESMHSGTRGGSRRKMGARSWTGGWTGEGGLPAVFPGESFAFKGYAAPDNDTEGGVGATYAGTAVVNQVVLNIDKATNAILSHTVSFIGSGACTEASADTAITDATDTISYCAEDVDLSHSVGNTLITDWTQATLTMTSQISTFVNSSTSRWTVARPTSNLNWNATIVIENANTPAGLTPGTQLANFKWGVNDTESFVFNYARVGAYSGITADRESKAIISQTLNLGMDSNQDSDGAIGSILKPDGSTLWPPTLA